MARILVADTDKSVRDLVRLRLTAWGHDVVSFADGQSALQAWREEHFDLTLLDLDLPRVGGLDVLRAIRATDSAEWPTVVLMSNHGRSERGGPRLRARRRRVRLQAVHPRVPDLLRQRPARRCGQHGARGRPRLSHVPAT